MNPTHTPFLLRRELQHSLDTLASTHKVPGAQLVVDTGSEIVAVHTGTADVATGTPLTADTAVPLGSLTKPCTAALVLLLADDGDLDLDDPAAEYLPELRDVPTVTIRQLLSHTGGLPTGPDSDTAGRTTAAHYLASVCTARDLLFAPGTDFSYSNAGYVAAGRIAETVTGMPWHEAVGALLLEPMGIMPAFLGVPAGRPVAAGHGFNVATGQTRPVQQNLAPLEAPAGALLASAIDLGVLGRAVAGQSLCLPSAIVKHMSGAEPGAEAGALADGWGLGLALFEQGDQTWCGHDGNAQGTSCHLRVEPDSGVVVAFTGNAGAGTALWRDLAEDLERIAGMAVPAGMEPVNASDPVALPDCAGTYANGSTRYDIALQPGGSPTLSIDGDLELPLVCYADLTCDLVDPATGRRQPGGRFHRDPDSGVIDRVQISGRTARRTSSG
ncbi:CubicO group peptidase (beta-lactamase class C family) [Catenulispora sp. MAP12-49]|uniref:serine hydrolase domain-containing protein n=1 Tax=Catenulispora sp. MAP12-49 TaxID=3156302 RepID=UPI003517B942